MQIGIRYGRGVVNIEVPDQNLVVVLDIQPSAPIADPEAAIWKALTAPIDSPSLAELAKGQQTTCVVISDVARSVPNKLILPPILQTLEAGGIARGQIIILVATGIHCPNFGAELEEMVGVEIMANYRILNHYSERLETHTDLGTTENGTLVLIDCTCVEADLKITTALTELHLMAGYSGGRKAICPGLASIETMKIMHGPEILEHPKAATGVFAGNPFHVEATEIARIAGVDFTLNVTIDTQRRLTGVLTGDLETAHLADAEFTEKSSQSHRVRTGGCRPDHLR
ncbi:hypothetical protein CMK14_02370 [Candidatus Poribacteria bacterium]|nr:hypothetical protein [Candidatus Poribacteria bacterium]